MEPVSETILKQSGRRLTQYLYIIHDDLRLKINLIRLKLNASYILASVMLANPSFFTSILSLFSRTGRLASENAMFY